MMDQELFKMFMALKILVAFVLLTLIAASVWPFGKVRRRDPKQIWRKRDRELIALLNSICPDQRKLIDINSTAQQLPLEVTQTIRFRGLELMVSFFLSQKEATITIQSNEYINALPIKTNLGLCDGFDYLIHTYHDDFTSEQLYELQRLLFNWKFKLNR